MGKIDKIFDKEMADFKSSRTERLNSLTPKQIGDGEVENVAEEEWSRFISDLTLGVRNYEEGLTVDSRRNIELPPDQIIEIGLQEVAQEEIETGEVIEVHPEVETNDGIKNPKELEG